MAEYQGHRSWNAWNVSLWLNNDEMLYSRALGLVQRQGYGRAARILAREIGGTKTPDGATYNLTCIREAIRGIAS